MCVKIEFADHVCTISIDNPPVNALHPDLAEEILDTLNDVSCGSRDARAIIPTGVGEAFHAPFMGDRLSAKEALAEGGLVEARAIAERIAKYVPLAVRAAKEAVNAGLQFGLAAGLQWEAVLFSKLFHSADVKEGVNAFLDSRAASFSGRYLKKIVFTRFRWP